MKFKLKDLFQKVRIGVAVAKVVTGGAHSKLFGEIENGVEMGEKAKEIADLVKQLSKKNEQ